MRLFGGAHMMMLAAVAALSVVLPMALRRKRDLARSARLGLGFFLAGNEVIWYWFRLHSEGLRFPEGLPLHLCDLVLWLTVFAVFTLKPLPFEVAYYGGLGGSGIALLTPDLWAPFPSYPTIYFFLSHGLVVVILSSLAWGRVIWPRPGSLWRAYGLLNLYAFGVAGFNFWFGTNYMYLRSRPDGASLLDYFGPWPIYILVADLFALGVFWLLWLPWGISRTRG